MDVSPFSPNFTFGSENTLILGQFLKFLINVASTMVLGMSNTYQQLATALQVGDVAYMLSKYGDYRVGTNSPFAINYKRTGRLKAWLCWSFLILTSIVDLPDMLIPSGG